MSDERIPEPARTSLLIVVSLAVGVLLAQYAHDWQAGRQVCYPASYTVSTGVSK